MHLELGPRKGDSVEVGCHVHVSGVLVLHVLIVDSVRCHSSAAANSFSLPRPGGGGGGGVCEGALDR